MEGKETKPGLVPRAAVPEALAEPRNRAPRVSRGAEPAGPATRGTRGTRAEQARYGIIIVGCYYCRLLLDINLWVSKLVKIRAGIDRCGLVCVL